VRVTTVRQRVADIEAVSGDPEDAHSDQDTLYRDVLEFIAGHDRDLPGRLAAEALKVEEIDFPRWCA
jgi:hypothetical protein